MAFIQRFTIPKENLTTVELGVPFTERAQYGSDWEYYTYTCKLTYCKSPVIFGNVGESTRTLISQNTDIPTSDKYYFALAVSPFTLECSAVGPKSGYTYTKNWLVTAGRTNKEGLLGMTMSAMGASGYQYPDLQDIMLEMIKAFPYKLTKVTYPKGYPFVNGAYSELTSTYEAGFYSNYENRLNTPFIPQITSNSDGGWELTCTASSTTEYKLQMPPLYELAFAYAPKVGGSADSGSNFGSEQTTLVMVMPVLINSSGRVITDSDL